MESEKIEIKNMTATNVVTGREQDIRIYAVYVDQKYTATIGWTSDKLQFSGPVDPLQAKRIAKFVAKELDREVVVQMPPNVPDSFFNDSEESHDSDDDFDA